MNPNNSMPIPVPGHVAVCPICSAPCIIEEIQDWGEENGKIVIYPESSVSVSCTTEPDIDGDEWEDWMRGHWNTPYIDWLPISQKVTRWLSRNIPTSWNHLGQNT